MTVPGTIKFRSGAWAGAALVLLAAALSGCAPPARAPVESAQALGGDETIVIGRVELVPPLRKGEQRIRGLGTSDVENKIYLLVDERERALPQPPALSDYEGRIEATLGSHFFVRSASRPFYILGGVLMLDLSGNTMNRAYFPGRLKVALRPGDRAVYIGTLRYHRDEFFEITKVAVVDEYEAARGEYAKKFGSTRALRKALMSPQR